jgi:uncharacterized metal-binding protein
MPAAKTHDQIALLSGAVMAPLGGIAWLAAGSSPADAAINTALLTGSYLACSHWLSPDLDIDSTIIRRWGVFGFFWRPYERVVPHRHWISHSGFSVVLRLLYLLVPLLAGGLAVAWLMGGSVREAWEWLAALVYNHPEQTAMVLAGAVASDGMHTITDHLSTTYKQHLRQRVRRRPARRPAHPQRRASPLRPLGALLRPGLTLRLGRKHRVARRTPARRQAQQSFYSRHYNTVWFVGGMLLALLLFFVLMMLQQQYHAALQ